MNFLSREMHLFLTSSGASEAPRGLGPRASETTPGRAPAALPWHYSQRGLQGWVLFGGSKLSPKFDAGSSGGEVGSETEVQPPRPWASLLSP